MSEEVIKWFREISRIPRESEKEKRISDFLVKFAKERNLEVYQDEALNVIIKKKASKGYENAPTVIIQGHIDMVCEKTLDSNHDFDNDPIELIQEGDILKANKTTLGADNGIAIAYSLALLDSDNTAHPNLEIVCTASEETNMNGALSLTKEHLSGEIILNIDGEEEGIFLISSAGGITPLVKFQLEKESFNYDCIKVKISNLQGGHSGMEIDKQRANAIKLMGRVLYAVKDLINIVHISGGSKDNAIASYAEFIIASKNINEAKEIISKIYSDIKNEYEFEDPDIIITAEDAGNEYKEMFSRKTTDDIIDFIYTAPYGVEYMFNNDELKGIVKASLNLGIVEENEKEVIITISIRSALDSILNEIRNKIKILARRMNADVEETSEYPSWQYSKESKIRDIVLKSYKDFSGKEPIITAVHAGLECGILKNLIPNADIISFGPDIFKVHTPEEYCSISSVNRTFEYLNKLLSEIKQ